jgi:hypothetical protein
MPWSVWLVIALCLAAQLSRRELPLLKHLEDNYTPAETDPRGLTQRLEPGLGTPAAGSPVQKPLPRNTKERT